MNKKVLRDTYLWKRKLLTSEEKSRREEILYKELESIISFDIDTVHTFLPIEKNAEVNTWPIIDFLVTAQKKVVVSKSNFPENTLVHYVYEGKSQLKLNKWSIPEPTEGEIVEPSAIDLVFIPLIIFDKLGHRIGYGKGYYDRFLGTCRQDVKKIGLSVSPPLDEIPYTNRHDVQMDACITHLGIYKF